ncbi:MAG: hypothetical protein AAFY02_19575 [Pseudomonadota bacterium]
MAYITHDFSHADLNAHRQAQDARIKDGRSLFTRIVDAYQRARARQQQRAYLAHNINAVSKDTGIDPRVLSREVERPFWKI